jgi:hypothetical protein
MGRNATFTSSFLRSGVSTWNHSSIRDFFVDSVMVRITSTCSKRSIAGLRNPRPANHSSDDSKVAIPSQLAANIAEIWTLGGKLLGRFSDPRDAEETVGPIKASEWLGAMDGAKMVPGSVWCSLEYRADTNNIYLAAPHCTRARLNALYSAQSRVQWPLPLRGRSKQFV